MNRKEFIRRTLLASAATLTPRFLLSSGMTLDVSGAGERILVIVQLSGGNDGLNTIIPYRDDFYFKLRPTISLENSEIIKVEDHFGFNNSMAPLRDLYDDGAFTVINKVGYPNPDRSHFRSMDIWHSASDANEYLNEGWIGRYLDHTCGNLLQPHLAIELDDALSMALKGKTINGLAVSDPGKMKKALSGPLMQELMQSAHSGNSNLDYLYKTLTAAGNSVEYLLEHSRAGKVSVDFPSTGFGKDLRMIATLINSGSATKIYYVSLSGFDTHNNQKNRQSRILKEYSDGISAFYQALKTSGNWNRTLVMTFSEFGRRVEQNASGGTDHGKANTLFLMGGGLKSPGIRNSEMDLSRLDDGDLSYETDFRRIYASVLQFWLKTDASTILGHRFDIVPDLI